MKNIDTIKGINEIVNNYDTFILDQWGVMHDGQEGYELAIQCVEHLYKKNKQLIIISNSSKRKASTTNRLSTLGFDPRHFIQIMTSGEMIWQSLIKKNYNFTRKLLKNYFYIFDETKDDAKNYLTGLVDYNFVNSINDADFILGCTPTSGSSIVDYIPLLTKAVEKNLPFVCANPDFETIENNSEKFSLCMGALAEMYKNIGGKVFILGKPSIEIYIESTKKLTNLNKSKIIAVGDSLHHDIKGANLFGIDSLLITSGIHSNFFDKKLPSWKTDRNVLQKLEIEPTFLCSHFKN